MNWQMYQDWLATSLLSKLPLDKPCPRLDQLITDSREIKKGDWFLPLKGETYDGHDFIRQAIAKGASGYFIKEGVEFSEPGIPFIKVKDTMKAYHLLASGWRKSLPKEFQLVALTGSVGKTTAKTMISTMLSNIAKTYSTPGNQNTEFSIPKAIFEMDASYRYGVLEFGARHPGDIALLTETALPDVAICLNAGTSHIEIFKTREAILNTKLEIISKSPQNAIGVILRDDARILEKAKTFGRKFVSFGKDPESDVVLKSYSHSSEGMSIDYLIQKELYTLTLPLYHETYAINAAAALAAGLALKLSPSQCIEGLKSFSGIKGRYKLFPLQNGKTLIDDSYNASPESMKAGLTSVFESYSTKKKMLILGDMRELGEVSESSHRELAPYCLKLNPTWLITVGQQSKYIEEESLKLGMSSKSMVHFEKVENLLDQIDSFIKDIDLIYIKGSFAIQLSRIVEKLTLTK